MTWFDSLVRIDNSRRLEVDRAAEAVTRSFRQSLEQQREQSVVDRRRRLRHEAIRSAVRKQLATKDHAAKRQASGSHAEVAEQKRSRLTEARRASPRFVSSGDGRGKVLSTLSDALPAGLDRATIPDQSMEPVTEELQEELGAEVAPEPMDDPDSEAAEKGAESHRESYFGKQAEESRVLRRLGGESKKDQAFPSSGSRAASEDASPSQEESKTIRSSAQRRTESDDRPLQPSERVSGSVGDAARDLDPEAIVLDTEPETDRETDAEAVAETETKEGSEATSPAVQGQRSGFGVAEAARSIGGPAVGAGGTLRSAHGSGDKKGGVRPGSRRAGLEESTSESGGEALIWAAEARGLVEDQARVPAIVLGEGGTRTLVTEHLGDEPSVEATPSRISPETIERLTRECVKAVHVHLSVVRPRVDLLLDLGSLGIVHARVERRKKHHQDRQDDATPEGQEFVESVDNAAGVSIRFEAEESEATDRLQRALPELDRRLRELQVDVVDLSVGLIGPN